MPVANIMKILAPGFQTTVQDLGRPGFGRYGVAASGALDAFSLRIANLLVGNSQDAAGLETMLMGLRFRALSDITVAITGADLQPRCDGAPFPMWRAALLQRGRELVFKAPKSGFRAYVAIGGGIQVPPLMASRSTNLPAGFGGLDGRALRPNDVLPGRDPDAFLDRAGSAFPAEDIPTYFETWKLRILWGPQDDHFSAAGRAALVRSQFAVSPQSDRTGIRLSGPQIERRPEVADSIISEGVIGGAIQVPGDGQPIILLNETVTGGYRKIATVIKADLPALGQIKPGDKVGFEVVSLWDADRALRKIEAKIARLRNEETG